MAPRRFDVRSIAVIGAGPAGLTAARNLLDVGHYDRIVVFEQRAEVGGLWNYSPRPTNLDHIPNDSPFLPPDPPLPPPKASGAAPVFPSPMYDELRINTPRSVMAFSTLTIDEAHKEAGGRLGSADPEPLTLFPLRHTIEAYLARFSREIRHLVRFSTVVEDVQLRRRATGGPPGALYADAWDVRTRSLVAPGGEATAETFDAVIVANGHYDIPYVPPIAHIRAFAEAHPGVVSHSKRYRRPDAYAGKKVLVVGNSVSGIEIGVQVSAVSQLPLYMSVRSPPVPGFFDRLEGRCEELPEIAEFLVKERGVRLTDGRELHDLDAVLFSTGYLIAYPFLQREKEPLVHVTPAGITTNGDGSGSSGSSGSSSSSSSSSSRGRLAPLLTDGRRVHGLYRDLFHIEHPTLAFADVPFKIAPLPFVQAQMAVVARVWANTLPLPSQAAMAAWETAAEKARTEPGFHNYPARADGVFINDVYDRIMESVDRPRNPARDIPRWGGHTKWEREQALQARSRFEATGHRAATMEELGLVYDGGDGDAEAERRLRPWYGWPGREEMESEVAP